MVLEEEEEKIRRSGMGGVSAVASLELELELGDKVEIGAM